MYVLLAGTRDRFRLVAPKYWFTFGALAIVIVCGIINNAAEVGPMLSGMRFYLRAVPLFFLPAVLPLTEDQLRRQLKWLLALSILQVPVAVYQRWVVQSEGRFTGDDVRGTIGDSGILSLFLICVVLVLTGMMLRGRIRPLWYWTLFFLLLLPTTINETKVTVFFLPAGLLVTLFIAVERGKRLKYFGMATAALMVTGALFVPIYNYTQEHNPYKNERDITALLTDQKALGRYLSSDVGGVGTKKDVRRGDAIVVPFEFLAHDPATLDVRSRHGRGVALQLRQELRGRLLSAVQAISHSVVYFLPARVRHLRPTADRRALLDGVLRYAESGQRRSHHASAPWPPAGAASWSFSPST